MFRKILRNRNGLVGYSTEKNAHSVDSVRLGIRNKPDGNGIARNNSHGLYKQSHGLKIKSPSLHLQAL